MAPDGPDSTLSAAFRDCGWAESYSEPLSSQPRSLRLFRTSRQKCGANNRWNYVMMIMTVMIMIVRIVIIVVVIIVIISNNHSTMSI
jgi:hypothetical protein